MIMLCISTALFNSTHQAAGPVCLDILVQCVYVSQGTSEKAFCIQCHMYLWDSITQSPFTRWNEENGAEVTLVFDR